MDICPKCTDEQPGHFHYKGDWHRRMIAEGWYEALERLERLNEHQ